MSSAEEDLESQNEEIRSDADTADSEHTVDSESGASLSWPDSENGDDILAEGYINAYQDEPLAEPGENELRAQEVNDDGLLAATLDARFEGTIPLNKWCRCAQCLTDSLVIAREYRCCWDVLPAIGKLQFDGSIDRIKCITQHQDYIDLTKRVVLENVGPLLRNKEGKPYKQQAGHPNEFLRAVAYRWLVRWMCGYLGWEHSRPLPACVYNKVRNEFETGQARGYSSSLGRQ